LFVLDLTPRDRA